MERPVVGVDLDNALAKLLPAALAWHNADLSASLTETDVQTADWNALWGSDKDEADKRRSAFFGSEQFLAKVEPVPGARETLKDLHAYFSFVVLTVRPRSVEKSTREWLDAHFPGLFSKLVFVDRDSDADIASRKQELYRDLKIKVAIGADASLLVQAAADVKHKVAVGSVPWTAAEADSGAAQVQDWAGAKDALLSVVAELGLTPADKVFSASKLSRYTDDLVTVSTRKPAVFYANIINSKFTVQKQQTVRLQASEAAITTAVQAAEMLRLQKNAVTTKIQTRYVFKHAKGANGHRVPKLELVLQRLVRSD